MCMSDTCNFARATQRQLAEVVEAAAQGGIGKARWGAMGKAQQVQAASVRVHAGDCAQHVRNIILAAISAAEAAHLNDQLE
eukprot:3563334-Pleurochrysis_carterae.AAC.1